LSRSTRRLAAALLATAALGGTTLGLTACGSSSSDTTASTPSTATSASTAPAAGSQVDVALGAPSELAMQLSAAEATAGSVTFHVHNAGKVTHEFVVIRSTEDAAHLPMENGEASEDGNQGEVEDLAPGATKDLTLNLPAGHYSLICNLPGHYAGGMHADLTVG
jgi:uncharacterized cupredoxin-like copper-binding protein